MFVKTLMIVVYSRKAAVSFWQTLLALAADMSFSLSAVEYKSPSFFPLMIKTANNNYYFRRVA